MCQDGIGFNMAALGFLKQEVADQSNANFFEAREADAASKKQRLDNA